MKKNDPPQILSPEQSTIHPTKKILFLLALVGSIFFVYWKTIGYTFIQDDWNILYKLHTFGSFEFLRSAWLPASDSFYRPIGAIYMVLLYNIFGINPVGFHIFALLIHCVNAILITLITLQFIKEVTVACSVGFLYALSIAVHLDPLMWMVGAFDLLGALFLFSSILFFLKKKNSLSLISFILAILTKEATTILPGILYGILITRLEKEKITFRNLLAQIPKLKYYALALLLFFLIRYQSLNQISDNGENPYAMSMIGIHVVDNIVNYANWIFEAIIPSIQNREGTLLLVGIAVIIIIFAFMNKSISSKKVFALFTWSVVGLLPVIFLHNHSYRYYLTYSYPAFIIMTGIAIHALFRLTPITKKLFPLIMVCIVLMNAIFGYKYISDLYKPGKDVPTVQGTNNLMRKGPIIVMIKEFLLTEYPQVPDSAVIIFNWLPTSTFGGETGIRLWYDNHTLSVYEIQDIIQDSTGMYKKDPNGNKGATISSDLALIVKYTSW